MTFPKLPNAIILAVAGLVLLIINTYWPNDPTALWVAGAITAILKGIEVMSTKPTVPVDEVTQAASRSGVMGAPIKAPGPIYRWFFD